MGGNIANNQLGKELEGKENLGDTQNFSIKKLNTSYSCKTIIKPTQLEYPIFPNDNDN